MDPRVTTAGSGWAPGAAAPPLPALGGRARARWATFEPGVAQLVLVDQSIVPGAAELAGWIDTLVRAATPAAPVRAVRTGALFPDAAAPFLRAGFDVVDVLALLELDLRTASGDRWPSAPSRRSAPFRTRRLRRGDHVAASLVDRRAFGDPFGYGPDDLADVRGATPVHRARAVRVGAQLTGFAISGASGANGYLQRLAVDPARQRQGIGVALVTDALAWMVRRRLRRATVNTGVDNEPALALYARTGFSRLPEQLRVLQLDVATPAAERAPSPPR